jgi:integrase
MATIRKRLRTDGSISYQVQVRKKGCPPETASFDRLADARRWAASVETAIDDGRFFPRKEAARHTLANAIDRYKRDILYRKASSTVPTVAARLEWWKDQIGDYSLDQVTPALIADCRDRLLREGPGDQSGGRLALQGGGVSPTTGRHYLMALGHVFAVAVREWGWLKDSPMPKVDKPRMNPGRVRFLTQEELAALLEACRDSDCGYLYPAVILAITTGMRRGEELGLTWDQVDLERGWITLGTTKNKDRRGVPVVGAALEALRSLRKVRRIDTDLVFPSHDGEKSFDLRKPFARALHQAEIRDFRWHDLRHCAASYLAMSGVPLKVIGQLLGHRTSAMTDRYSHLADQVVTDAVTKVMNKLFG